MKTVRNIIVIIIIFIGCVMLSKAEAQSKVSLSIHQDVKLLLSGSEHTNASAPTLDLLFRFKMQGNQLKGGYIFVYPEFEFAEIEGTFKRYSAGAGFVFNELFIDNLEFGVGASYGWIDRYGLTLFSFGGSGELNYKITKNLKFSLLAQLTERKDLRYFFNDSQSWILSGFAGVEINL